MRLLCAALFSAIAGVTLVGCGGGSGGSSSGLLGGGQDPDPAVQKRVFEAMMEMRKIDVAAIEKARRG